LKKKRPVSLRYWSLEMAKVTLSDGNDITMREPKVRDMMMVKDIDNDMDRELELIGNLTDMSKDELYDLSIPDYRQLQNVLMGFQSSKPKT
jgi:Phage tail assembly chaperone proteins, E, or 41 or 14